MGMSESGKAVRELLALIAGVSPADLALAELEDKAMRGGARAVESVRGVVKAGRVVTARANEAEHQARVMGARADRAERRIERLEFELTEARASLRAMVGAALPEDTRQVMDPPKSHRWTTGVWGGVAGDAAAGRLVCVVCTGAEFGGEATGPEGGAVVLASECLERNR